jgi:hypothetical protein
MKATPLTPAEIFGNQIRYVVPLFQRPYVWNEVDQWAPLWSDVAGVAEQVLSTPIPPYGPRQVPPHFLGAVVVDQQHVGVHYISVRGIVDGQQRMTTLQLLLDAAQAVVAAHGAAQDAQALEVLVLNPAQLSPDKDERFKVWPTNRDQAAFRAAMDDSIDPAGEVVESRIVKAHRFFMSQIQEWADVSGDPGKVAERLNALTVALRDFLKLVVIDLEPGDNAQVIFETLNHRGTPLLAADLIKNLIFQTAQQQGLDVGALYADYWSKLDTDYWRNDINQGRLYRPRIDVFMNYWLTMTRRREIATDRVFVEFRDYLQSPDAPPLPTLLAEVVRLAGTYSSLSDADPKTVLGRFRYRVLQALDSSAVTPLLLWLLGGAGATIADDQRDKALVSMESWLIRRALCRYTAKGVNQLIVELLRELARNAPEAAGDVTERFLAAQTVDARLWPTNEHLITALTANSIYKNVGRPRLRVLLEAIEDDLRQESSKTEAELCPRNLTVEHLMPQAWKTYWPLADDDPLAAGRRDMALQTLGNLTLVTSALNPSMSNGPWDDGTAKAAGLAEGKRSALQHSVLRLNNTLTAYEAWGEQDIAQRGRELAERACRIWARPVPSTPAASVTVTPEPPDTQAHEIEAEAHAGKYAALFDWLREKEEPEVSTSFGAIEQILGFPLPASSREHLAHWYSYEGSAVARAVIDAGWRATKVDLDVGTVSFIRDR